MLSTNETQLVTSSWQQVLDAGLDAGSIFYQRLFQVAPRVRAMFPDDMQEQKKKLIGMISMAVKMLEQPQALIPALQQLGRKHQGYGAQEAHYAVVGDTLIWTLSQGLADQWTPDHEAAWGKTFQLMADTMITAQKEMASA